MTGYQVYWCVGGWYDGGNIISVGTEDTAVTITDRIPGLTYGVAIVALSDHLPSPVAVVMITLGESGWMYHTDVCHILKSTYVAVPGRNRTLFRCVFRSHCCVRSAVAQNFR